MGHELVIVLSPLYIKSIGGSILQIGLIFSVSSLGVVFLTIPGGIISDKFGRKRLALIAILFAATGSSLLPLAGNWLTLLPLMFVFMSSNALFLPARHALIADNLSRKNMAGIMGIMFTSYPIGAILGPLVGGWVVDLFGWPSVYYMATLIILLSTLPLLLLKETGENIHARSLRSLKTDFERDALRIILPIVLITAIMHTALSMTKTLLPLYLVNNFMANETTVGLFFTLTSIPYLGMALTGALADKIGGKRTMIPALAFMAPIFILCGLASSYNDLVIRYLLLTISLSLIIPATQAILISQTSPKIRGLASATRGTGLSLGIAVGPTIGASLWETFDPSTPFYVAAMIVLITLPIALLVKDHRVSAQNYGDKLQT